jgi:hypothetical protein
MKTITKYETEDGSIFSDPDKAQNYEYLCANLMLAARDHLKELPTGSDRMEFLNGGGYLQHEPALVQSYREAVCDAALDFFQKGGACEQWFKEVREGKRHISHVGRLVDDSGEKCLKNAIHRLMCIDPNWREWGQPYYAMNPGTGKDHQL